MPRPRRDSEILPAKERLENAFWELLSEREYRKITVTDIVRTADVNRNSFYYHFDDIPSLLEEILVEEADRFVATETDNNTSVYESLISVIDYAFSNKSVIQHIYNSANRTTFDVYLNRICTHAIKSYFDKLEITKNIAEDDLDAMIMYYKCQLVGFIIDWLGGGMKYDLRIKMKRICELFEGSMESALDRCAKINA